MSTSRKKQLLSYLMIAAGICLFFFGARDVLESHFGQSQIAHDFGAQQPAGAYNSSRPRIVRPQPGSAVAKLSIPRLDAQVYVVEGDGEAELRRGPGHLTGTAMPGANGNCVIAGHRDTHFRILKDIRKGDEILLETGQDRFRYRVRLTSVVSPDNTASLQPDSLAKLHLITCYPFYYVGPAPQRFVVEADLVRPLDRPSLAATAQKTATAVPTSAPGSPLLSTARDDTEPPPSATIRPRPHRVARKSVVVPVSTRQTAVTESSPEPSQRRTRRKLGCMESSSEDFYRIGKLPPYVFAVINERRAKARAAQIDVIDLGMGNPDGATPRPIVNKLIEASRNARNHRYSQSKGIPKLREAIVARYQANYGVELDPEKEAIVAIGAKDALAHLLFATVGPGDTVVSPNPAYPIHQYGVIMAEGQACMLPMPDANTFLSRLEDLLSQGPPRNPSCCWISFPHNPTTTCVDLDFFEAIVRLARHHGTMIIHDFAYADLGFDGYKPPSILQVEGAKDVAVEIFSLSKSYNMAGWRVGFCLGNPKMIAALARIKSYLDYGVFQPIQIASIIALRECEEDTRKICALYQKRRDVLIAGLNRAGWPVEKPRGSMFVWAPIPERFRSIGSLEFSKLLMEKALVAVSPGIGFGPLGEGFVRFALVENDQRIRQATRTIGQFLQS